MGGLFANFFVSILCWMSAVWLMYFADNAIDLILNGLAVYFMKTIDDEMVFGHDYAMIEEWFKDRYKSFVDAYIQRLDETEQDELDGICYRDCCHGQCIEDPARCWCILSPLVIIAPLYLAVCY